MTRDELRAALLAADDITVVPVPTPEFGPTVDGHLFVRLLSAGGRWKYLRGVRPLVEAGEAISDDGMVRESGLRLAAATLCDASGTLLFPDASPTDVAALAEKSWEAMQRVIDASAALNKFDAQAVEDAKKNSPAATAISDSSTG